MMIQVNCINIKVHNVSINLKTNSNEFILYLKEHFRNNVCFAKNNVKYKVNVEFQFIDGIDINDKKFRCKDGFNRVGRRLWIKKNELIWDPVDNTALKLYAFRNETNLLSIYAVYINEISRYKLKREFIKRVFKAKFKSLKFEIFELLIYYLVYFPAFYMLRNDGVLPIHASAVAIKNKGILIPGLPGAGKSTFSLGFLLDEHNKFLSDNIVLVNENMIFSCPEPIRLDIPSFKLLPGISKRLISLNQVAVYSRNTYAIKKKYCTSSVYPNIVILPFLSDKNLLTEISPLYVRNKILSYNHLAGEIRMHLVFNSAMDLVFNSNQNFNPLDILDKLLRKSNCYEFAIEKNVPIKDVIKKLLSNLDLEENFGKQKN